MRNQFNRVATLPLLVLAVSAVSGCVDQKVVYRDRSLFENPPSAADSFLGYSDQSSKLVVCGNCHVEKQAEWVQTKHASAWADLQASGHAQSSCEPCHSVSSNGNVTTGDVGFTATGDARYQDVQCESCHGPGLEHVTNPTIQTEPLAPLSVGTDLTTGCGECHQGTHEPFVDEWAQSAHATLVSVAVDNASCQSCHTGEGALASWGVNTNFAEKASLGPGNHLPIVCGVCHDPHGGPNLHQLRYPLDDPSLDNNLCMKCHQRNGNPDPTSSRGPHSPQGPLLLGTAGWWPPGLTGPFVGTHGTPSANPELCARCHVSRFTVTDAATGAFQFQATGHLFVAIPCLDSIGQPTANDNCTMAQRTFAACTGSGCHASEDVARSAMATAEARTAQLVTEIDTLLAQVPSTEFSTTDNRYTVAEGAKFNAQLAAMTGAPVHNPFLVESLLIASINALETTYNLSGSPNVSLKPMFKHLATNGN
jgi:predicted CXXCH cytochrome family protein